MKQKKGKMFLICMLFSLFFSHVSFPVQAEVNESTLKKIETYLKQQMEEQAIAGLSYAIVDEKGVIHSGAFGNADIEKKLTPQTPMRLASLSKSFTALAIMQLVEKGQIDLDAPVTTYIPWFSFKSTDLSKQISIRNLLNQTSGIPAEGEIILGTKLIDLSLEETVKLFKQIELKQHAGVKFEYTNLNYITLGLIVEYVTGEPLASYLQKNILHPLKMNESYVSVKNAEQNGLSKGYTSWFGFLLPTSTVMSDLPNFLASGYMVSSAEDMARYVKMHMNEGEVEGKQLLGKEGIKSLHTPIAEAKMYLNDEFFGHYAMGWWERTVHGTRVIGHSGDLFSAARTDMYILPEHDIGLVVLTNTNNGTFAPGNSHISTDGVINLLTGKLPTHDDTQTFKSYYLIFNVVSFILVLTLIFYLVRMIRKKPTRLKVWSFVGLLLQFILPTILLLFGPHLLHVPSWTFIYSIQTDLIASLIVLFITLIVIALIGLYKGFRSLRIFKRINFPHKKTL
ncbi:CubicO group peptidase (beta-lactamase class C family) [Salirhabdus euzebyi]|uniref:CubicO group peptidase (Beta-lactamase class C family) n=1 Tax=Salirhabdus euzebyi TaxID=394506 RepID=A0A841Q9I2_9BACI|nr:serine hydrolase domain-containing protein [Salirhabdus euzebyi]MBB6454963.1 CubicO group peptidase (beta-lactamase class C family) [Salirhabdus euzebyi]